MSQPAEPSQPATAHQGGEQRLVCAVLAAQVAALRDGMHTHSAVEALWQASDALSQLAGRAPPDCLAALEQVRGRLEDLAFGQVQSADCLSQRAECVVTALRILASAGARLPPGKLLALYVTEDQRRVHEDAAGRFAAGDCKPAKHAQ
jgi:hypothetical protein